MKIQNKYLVLSKVLCGRGPSISPENGPTLFMDGPLGKTDDIADKKKKYKSNLSSNVFLKCNEDTLHTM